MRALTSGCNCPESLAPFHEPSSTLENRERGYMKVVIVLVILGALAAAFKMLMSKNAGAQRPSGQERKARRTQGQARAAAPSMPSNSNTAAGGKVNWLIGMGGDVAGKRFHIGQRNITLGRAPTNYIQTTDDKASRQHCQIKPEANGIRVTDMASSNGTQVNGENITTRILEDGDSLEVGEAHFVFRRAVDFATDDGMARKAVGVEVHEATASAQGLQAIIEEALQGTGGDVDKAAQVLGIDADFIRTMQGMKD